MNNLREKENEMNRVWQIGNRYFPTISWWLFDRAIRLKSRIDLLHPDLNQHVHAGTCTIEEDIRENINIFVVGGVNDKYIADLQKDMIKCYFLYGINANEYFVHRFESKSNALRKEYISKRDKNYACRFRECGLETFNLLNDKYRFYSLTKTFFKRDVCKVENTDDRIDFINFASKHIRCIAKPLSSSLGNGCQILNIDNADLEFEKLLKQNKWILEELIEQNEKMALWNASSVNTVRICSFRLRNGEIKQIYPFLRMGRKGSLVDNAGHGGIYVSLNSVTGEICSKGMDKVGNIYDEHPDSHIKFDKWAVPQWEDLVKLSAEVHKSLPKEHIYVGFDFALDKEKGWVVIEGNWGDFICQQSSLGRGLRKDFINAIKGV